MLFTLRNPKTAKGEAAGYLTAVLHLAPATTGGHGNVCPNATPGCMRSCLNTAGRGGIMKAGATSNAIQDARKRRTAFYKLDPKGFEEALAEDIRKLIRKAERKGLKLAVRVNGTSDLPGLALALSARFPDVQFYDYTKIPLPWMRQRINYHLTFSRSEANAQDWADALSMGINVAVVFDTPRGKPLPETWAGRVVVDGDKHDLRFLDTTGGNGWGVIVGLRAKGKARKDYSGFVVTA